MLWLGSAWSVLGAASLISGMVLALLVRERFWHVRCERCRGKKRREVLATKPALDGNTEINLF